MSGKTLGQVAYEAYCRHVDRISPPPWEHLHSGYQDGWQEVAQAVAAHAASPDADGSGSAAENARLRDDLADAEAEIARWPRCPRGCRCRVGTDDADALECGCDGPCNGGAAPAQPQPAPDFRALVRDNLIPEPALELAAAMAETRRVLDLLDQATRAVLGKRWALTDSEKRIISGFRRQAGLDVSTRELAYAEDREAEDVADGDAGPEA